MNTRVEFKSAAFPKYPDEDAEIVNSNCWGKRLAEFVRDHLPKHGVMTEDILCEDWGWLVNIKNDDFPLWVGCGVMEDAEDSDEEAEPDAAPRPQRTHSDAGLTQFSVFVTAEPGLLQRLFKRVDTKPAVTRISDALARLVAATPEMVEVSWE